MSSQASPVVLRHRGKRAPRVGIVLAVLVAFLILFQWLHFALAQRIESAGREIQVKTAEIGQIERHNDELRRQISIAGSQERMSRRSRNMGYAAQRPVYLLVDHPLPPTSRSSQPPGQGLAGAVGGSEAPVGWPVVGRVAESSSGE